MWGKRRRVAGGWWVVSQELKSTGLYCWCCGAILTPAVFLHARAGSSS